MPPEGGSKARVRGGSIFEDLCAEAAVSGARLGLNCRLGGYGGGGRPAAPERLVVAAHFAHAYFELGPVDPRWTPHPATVNKFAESWTVPGWEAAQLSRAARPAEPGPTGSQVAGTRTPELLPVTYAAVEAPEEDPEDLDLRRPKRQRRE